ncbi:unnamed protein product [Cylicocyclus nassatus]|uniref:Peripheral subunit-binding (PSBD) domain-containing protein n=1 Tax=Cylicocyclus nassatus TaxID=53992 RepID=A0AA36M7S0_CYLNA|nr:unnamed protein product [Cylicocyclus nassatus]
MLSSRSIASSVRALSTSTHGSTGLCGPAVKLLMLQYGINEKDVKATGPKKNILKGDVMGVIKAGNLKPVVFKVSPPPQPAPSAAKTQKAAAPTGPVGSVRHVDPFVDIPLSNVRATIAKRLTQSKQSIPHEYQSADIRADAILAIQADLRAKDVAVSINDFLIKAAALALRAVPEVNVRYSNEQVQYMPTVDISVAVATPNGLITPIVFSADIMGVQDISARVRELAARARENKLQPQEFQGGTFTISNLGMFGSVEAFTAIINPPQAAILAVGGTRTEMDNDMKPQSKFTATLCFDARAITETSAKRFLDHFAASLSDPDFMVAEPIDPALNFDFARLL